MFVRLGTTIWSMFSTYKQLANFAFDPETINHRFQLDDTDVTTNLVEIMW